MTPENTSRLHQVRNAQFQKISPEMFLEELKKAIASNNVDFFLNIMISQRNLSEQQRQEIKNLLKEEFLKNATPERMEILLKTVWGNLWEEENKPLITSEMGQGLIQIMSRENFSVDDVQTILGNSRQSSGGKIFALPEHKIAYLDRSLPEDKIAYLPGDGDSRSVVNLVVNNDEVGMYGKELVKDMKKMTPPSVQLRTRTGVSGIPRTGIGNMIGTTSSSSNSATSSRPDDRSTKEMEDQARAQGEVAVASSQRSGGSIAGVQSKKKKKGKMGPVGWTVAIGALGSAPFFLT